MSLLPLSLWLWAFQGFFLYLIYTSAVPAFRDVIDVPLVVRRLHRSRKEVLVSKSCREVLQLLDLVECIVVHCFSGYR